MTKRILILAALALALATPSLTDARDRNRDSKETNKEAKGPWIHVEVMEDGEEGAKVKVNLPLSMARIALEMAPEDVFAEGRMQIDDHDFTIDDLRELWKELRESGDAEFVTVEDGDETVRVFRKGDRIFVQTDEDGEGDETVRIEVPVALVDALLSGRGDDFNYDAALAALEDMDETDIVLVRDGDDVVRVWID